ncbi:MHYT domain-containing protein [Streptomyces sp. NPDC006475]|uniref:MHYT domain-containing protein n=1 Tax=Streptomyces sp. NPDC006475 TaxID=3155719 RepID=UPI0033B2486A
MSGEIDGFRFGMVTPVAAYLMAALGSSLGLRCMVRTLHHGHGWKAGWLTLGAASIGCGIWTMHFIAMMGFTINDAHFTYDEGRTVLSLVIAIAVVSVGVFIVGYFGATVAALGVAGPITGAGVAAMHYVGMTAMHTSGSFRYDTPLVVLSVVIAVGAATAALWAAVRVTGFRSSLLAGLVLAVAVTAMHYTAMAALNYHPVDPAGDSHGHSSTMMLLPMLTAPVFFLLFTAFIVMFDPLLLEGESGGTRTSPDSRATAALGPSLPGQVIDRSGPQGPSRQTADQEMCYASVRGARADRPEE